MEQSKDFIEREIQKLVLLLTALISKVNGTEAEDFDETLQEVNESLEEKFGFRLEELEEMDNQELLIKMGYGDEMTVDTFTKLLHQIITKTDEVKTGDKFNKKKLANKAIFLIDHINKNSSTFSLERMKMKKDLQQWQ